MFAVVIALLLVYKIVPPILEQRRRVPAPSPRQAPRPPPRQPPPEPTPERRRGYVELERKLEKGLQAIRDQLRGLETRLTNVEETMVKRAECPAITQDPRGEASPAGATQSDVQALARTMKDAVELFNKLIKPPGMRSSPEGISLAELDEIIEAGPDDKKDG